MLSHSFHLVAPSAKAFKQLVPCLNAAHNGLSVGTFPPVHNTCPKQCHPLPLPRCVATAACCLRSAASWATSATSSRGDWRSWQRQQSRWETQGGGDAGQGMCVPTALVGAEQGTCAFNLGTHRTGVVCAHTLGGCRIRNVCLQGCVPAHLACPQELGDSAGPGPLTSCTLLV